MKSIQLFFLLISALTIIGCSKDNVPPQAASQTCRAASYHTTSIVVSTDDTSTHSMSFAYNGSDKLISATATFENLSTYNLYLEYDGHGRVSKYTDGDGSGADNWKYSYDNSGRMIGQIYGYGGQTHDSSIYTHTSSTQVTETEYNYLPNDTVLKYYVLDGSGNYEVYSNEFREDSLVLIQKYEYYPEVMPSNFIFNLTPDIFQRNNLLKKFTWYTHFFNGIQLVSKTESYEFYTYTIDSEGKVTQYIRTRDVLGDSKDIVNVTYDCQ